MRKRIWGLVLALCMLATFAPITASAAESGTCGDNLTWTLDEQGKLIISGIGSMNGYAFYDNLDVKSVIIEDGITSIGENAFFGCSSMSEIYIADSVNEIGNGAFAQCKSLQHINIPEGVTRIDESTFTLCLSLENVNIPDSVTEICDNAFHYCSALTKIYIPDSVILIGRNAFDGCENLSTIHLPDNIPYVGGLAFRDTTWYNNLPDGDVYIGKSYYAYKGNIPNNYKLTIVNGTLKISEFALSGMDNVISVSIPDSVEIIGGGAFYRCNNLKEISMGNNIKDIGYEAFKWTGYYVEPNNWYDNSLYNGALYIGPYLIESKNNSKKEFEFKNGTKLIATAAFEGMGGGSIGNENLVIPNSVQYICDTAFSRNGFKTVTIPKSVVEIGDNAFGDTYNLTDVYYEGSKKSWANIKIGNNNFGDAVIHFGEIEPCFIINNNANDSNANITNTAEETVSAVMIIAEYDIKGSLVNITSQTVSFSAGEEKTISFENNNSHKVFVWDSLKGMYPLNK